MPQSSIKARSNNVSSKKGRKSTYLTTQPKEEREEDGDWLSW